MQIKSFSFLNFPLIALSLIVLIQCASSGKISLDLESKDFYETTRLIMTKQERDVFSHLPDKESREEFIREFWAKRDPNPETEENEFKEEFFRRIEYANMHFKEGPPGWKTDRGRIYVYLGPPDKTDETLLHGDPSVKGAILWWIYYRYELGIKFVDKNGYGHFTYDPYYGVYGDLFDAIERAKLGFIGQQEGMPKKYINFDVVYDKSRKEIIVSLPVIDLTFKEEEGLLKAEFDFELYIYEEKGAEKKKIIETRSFQMAEKELLKQKEIIFSFPIELKHGKHYVDVVVIGRPDMWKTRKIIEIKV